MLSNRALLQEGIVTEVAFVDISLICFIAMMIIIAEPLLTAIVKLREYYQM